MCLTPTGTAEKMYLIPRKHGLIEYCYGDRYQACKAVSSE